MRAVFQLNLPEAYLGPGRENQEKAAQGDAEAQFRVGIHHHLMRRYSEGEQVLQRAAAQGHIGAQSFLGKAYKDGAGFTQNDAESERWYRQAKKNLLRLARQGDVGAQLDLARFNEKGLGTPNEEGKNPLVAGKWYARAAKNGSDEALRPFFNVISALNLGKGSRFRRTMKAPPQRRIRRPSPGAGAQTLEA